uniref:Secreted protein n=1 Tax=Ixodes ricinus TaxID=34613 RepID=A0A6B0UEP3_IXORI
MAMFLFMLSCLCHFWDTLTHNKWRMIIIVHVICIDTYFWALPVQFCLLKLAFNASDIVCRTAALKNIVCFAGTMHHLLNHTGIRNPINASSLY